MTSDAEVILRYNIFFDRLLNNGVSYDETGMSFRQTFGH